MTINYETIDFSSSEYFRILRWNKDVNQVETLDSHRGQFVPMSGTGGYWHWHQEIEITFVESGFGVRVVGDETCDINGNTSLVILGRGLPHYWDFRGPSSGVCLQFCDMRLMKSLTEQARGEMIDLIGQAAYGSEIRSHHCQQAIGLLQRLATQPPAVEMETYGLVFQLLGSLAAIQRERVRQISSIRFDGHQANANYVEMQKAVHWIMEHYDAEIPLQQILDLVQMSKASFSRHFVKCTGVNFSQFVNQVRISNASRLLHTTQESVSSIAFQTGFSNLSNFNRIFRKLKGVAPSDYRRSANVGEGVPVEEGVWPTSS